MPHTWEPYIRQLKLGCLWGKSVEWQIKLKVHWTILKIIKSRTPDHPAYHSVSWKLELSRGDFLYQCPLLSIRLKGGCYRGGLNGGFNGLFPWSGPDMTVQSSSFLHWWGCFTSYVTLREGCVCKSTHHGCEHICVNRGNSYICKCSKGFILAEDGRRCKSKWSELGFSCFNLVWEQLLFGVCAGK